MKTAKADTTMRSPALGLIILLALIASACGGGSDAADSAPVVTEPATDAANDDGSASEASSSTTSTGSSDESDDQGTDDAADAQDAQDAMVDASSDTDAIESQASDAVVDALVASLPGTCREGLVEALALMAPIVGDTDWSTATVRDVTVATDELDALPDPFETRPECEDIAFEDTLGTGVILRIAEQEEPSTVGFLAAVTTMFGAGSFDAVADPDCDAALATIQDAASRYATIEDMPVAEFQQLSPLMFSLQLCPGIFEQLESDPAVQAFLDS